jgi:adenylate kinase
MNKTVILITGTPAVGKTTTAKKLAKKLDALYINLSLLVHQYNLSQGYDKERNTIIINEKKVREKIKEILDSTIKKFIIIDGHYAASVVPKKKVAMAFVLRRNPIELKKFLGKRKFSENKLWENLESEILDVCLMDTLSKLEKTKVCEIDVTGKTIIDVINQILAVLNKEKKSKIGIIDWLTMLETKGLLDDYLKK